MFLGTFEPNTAIGWFLIPNGWAGRSVVERPEIKYSTKSLNTFTSAAYRQHIVQLKDPAREILLLGMEDLSRPSGDNDFNDAVFFITANPYSAIITDNVPDTKQPTGWIQIKTGSLIRMINTRQILIRHLKFLHLVKIFSDPWPLKINGC